jgi:hypothetical protein
MQLPTSLVRGYSNVVDTLVDSKSVPRRIVDVVAGGVGHP